MNPLGLEYLSVFGQHPAEFIRLAGDLGCSHVTLNLAGAANRLSDHAAVSFRHDPAVQREIAAALRERGVTIGMVEGFAIAPEITADDYTRDLDMVAGLGARAICAVSLDRDMARTHAGFARIAAMAADRGMFITTEVGAGVVRRLDTALAVIEAVADPAFRLLIDTMHFFRFGGTVGDFAALDPAAIGHVQLSDVPMPAVIESYMEEALYERRAPGDGDLPLAEFLQHVPESVVVGLEIPIRSEAEAGAGPHQRLGRCVTAARALIPAGGRAATGRPRHSGSAAGSLPSAPTAAGGSLAGS